MDARTAQRTGGSYAGTTFDEHRGPSVDDRPWCTSYADVDHVFRWRDWEQGGGGRVPLDLITVMIRSPDHVGR